MKQLTLTFSFILLFSGCAQLAEMQAQAKRKQEGNTTASTEVNPYVVQNSSSKSRGYLVSHSPKGGNKKENMVHIVRKANGTTIEFWIDLYNDDVKIDYEFDNSETLEHKVELMPTKVHAVSKTARSDKTEMNMLELYLASYEKAQQYIYNKKYKKALVNINKALDLSPKTVQGWKLKGSILYKLNDKVGAKKAWKKALELDPYASDVKKSLQTLSQESK